MIIHVTIKGQEIKMTRKEYLRRFTGNKQKKPVTIKCLQHLQKNHQEIATRGNWDGSESGISYSLLGNEK